MACSASLAVMGISVGLFSSYAHLHGSEVDDVRDGRRHEDAGVKGVHHRLLATADSRERGRRGGAGEWGGGEEK